MNRIQVWSMVGLFLSAEAPSRAGPMPWLPAEPRGGEYLVVNHQPYRYGGLTSDTEFRDMFDREGWQRVADDFRLDAPAQLSQIRFWGYYGHGFESPAPDPPTTEMIRVRFYDARPSDALPGTVLLEESFVDPARTATGEIVADANAPLEYIFEIRLSHAFYALPDTAYWLEIVQIGDIDSHLRWEFSRADVTSQAVTNNIVEDWHLSVSSDAAFQLWAIPEPASLILVCLGATILTRRCRNRIA